MAMPVQRTQWVHGMAPALVGHLNVGPGAFRYRGNGYIIHHTPTFERHSGKDPALDEQGQPIVDGDGNQIWERPGKLKRDHLGRPYLGGPPKVAKGSFRQEGKELVFQPGVPVESWQAPGGKMFPKGKLLKVNDPHLCIWLRNMKQLFEERPVEEAEDVLDPEPGEGIETSGEASEAEMAAAQEAERKTELHALMQRPLSALKKMAKKLEIELAEDAEPKAIAEAILASK